MHPVFFIKLVFPPVSEQYALTLEGIQVICLDDVGTIIILVGMVNTIPCMCTALMALSWTASK